MNAKHVISVVGSAFASGALAWVGTHMSSGIPTNMQGAEAFAAGAALAGLVALYHLYQPAPGSPQAIAAQAAMNAVETEAAKLGVK